MEQERALRAAQIRRSGNREFGFVMAGAFCVATLYSAWRRQGLPSPVWPSLAALFTLFAALFPHALAPLNAVWTLLGRALHRVVSPLVLGVLYFAVLTPFAFVFRFFRRDPLRLARAPEAETYWIRRSPEDQPGQGMANQH